MIKKRFVIHMILSVLLIHAAAAGVTAQPDLPEKPDIQLVTIDSTNGKTYIEWKASASPGTLGYKVYTLDITTFPVTGYLVDSLPGAVLSYSYLAPTRDSLNHTSERGAPYYTVTAVNDAGESLLSGNYHKPVMLDVRYDSCNSALELEWEEYVGWEEHLNGYRIYAKSVCDDDNDHGVDHGDDDDDKKHGEHNNFILLATNRADETSFTHDQVDENCYYEYVVEAFDYQDNRSTSKRKKYYTYMPAPPEFVSLDYVTVLDDRTVEISISADISGEINDFLVSRSTSPQGSFTAVQTLLDVSESNLHITDNVVTKGQHFYYKVEALNSCFHPVKSSNLGNNILLRGKAEASTSIVQLEWNPYEEFPGGVDSYAIFRKNAYDEHELIATVSPDLLSYSEDIRHSGDKNIEGEVKYMIEARENGNNPLGITGVSRSNEVVVNIESRMYLPNAFTPNGDGQNDYFAPVIDFIPEEYRMFIYDRTGNILFQTTDPLMGWDGSVNGSGKAREGVYVYHIEFLSFNGTRQIETGNLTLVYP